MRKTSITTQFVTIDDSGIKQAQEQLNEATYAGDFAETKQAFTNKLLELDKSLGKTRSITLDSGAKDGGAYTITIDKSTVNKVASSLQNAKDQTVAAQKLVVLKNLDEIVQSSTYVESGKSIAKRGGKSTRHDYFEAPVTIGGETYTARLDIVVNKTPGSAKPQNVVRGIEVTKAPEQIGEPNTTIDRTSAEEELEKAYFEQISQLMNAETAGNNNPSLDNSTGEGYNGSGKLDAAIGAGDNLRFKSWKDFSGYIQNVGKDISLTVEEKVQKIQKAYNGIADKTDINIPISAQYVKGFTAEGRIEYDWPKYLGLDETTITSISRDNLLPENWDRYGPISGSNFSDIPSSGRYSYGERSIPYVENEEAYHSGKFNNATYFDKIDAIRTGDLGELNVILQSEGISPVSEMYFEELMDKYNYFIEKSTHEIGTSIDATYGIKGKAAAWGELMGGAGQIITPLVGEKLLRLGIII